MLIFQDFFFLFSSSAESAIGDHPVTNEEFYYIINISTPEMELEANIFRFFSSDAETPKNALFLHDFENRYPTRFISRG